jgi:hypothetical protein
MKIPSTKDLAKEMPKMSKLPKMPKVEVFYRFY